MLNRRAQIVIDTLLPHNAHPELKWGAWEAGFPAFYETFEREALFSMRFGFRFALFLAIWVAPLLILRFPPIMMYGRETRERAIQAMGNSRLYLFRQMYLLLKATVSFHYGADPRVRQAIGFPEQFDAPGRKEVV